MMTTIRTYAKFKIIDPSKGKAKIVAGPKHLTERSEHMTHMDFSNYQRGEELIAEIKVSGRSRRRTIKSISVPNERLNNLLNKAIEEDKAKREKDGVAHITAEAELKEEVKTKIGKPPLRENDITKGIFFNKEIATVLNFSHVLALKGKSPFVNFVGASGYGKTESAKALAEQTDRDFLYWNCATVRDQEEWYGYREAVDGSTVFIPTLLTQKIREGNCVIVFDEFNRVDPSLHNSLFPLLDDRGETLVKGETITKGPNLIFVATCNLGFQFTGTFEMDQALLNRFDATCVVGPLPKKVEARIVTQRFSEINAEFATKIVNIVSKLREIVKNEEIEVDVSTRSTLKISKWCSVGMSLRDSIYAAIINSVNSEESRPLIDCLNTNL